MGGADAPGHVRAAGLALPESLWATLHRIATGEGWPPSSREAAERLVATAMREGLLPLLFAQEGWPSAVSEALARLRALERLSRRQTELVLAASRQVFRAFGDEPFIVLKGADYGHRLYSCPALRPMGDVDLLVPRERIAAIATRLRGMGLVDTDTGPLTKLPGYYARTFRLGDVSVDVHHSFVQRTRTRIDYGAVWRRRIPVTEAGNGASRLADADALVYHALTMAKDELHVPLLRYVDLWLMARGDPGLLPEAVARAREWQVERALYGALTLGAEVFVDLDAGPARAAREALLTRPARAFLDRCVLPDAWEHARRAPLSRGHQLWRKLWLMDGVARRLAFGAYHVYALVRTRGRVEAPSDWPIGGST